MMILMFVLWIVLNGRITLEICLFGILLSAAFGLFMNRMMDYHPADDRKLWKKSRLILEYMVTLIREVAKANLRVIELVWHQDVPVAQTLITFPVTELKTDAARAVLANTITLTPGTITVSLSGDQYTVHCLDRRLIEGIETSEFIRILKEWEAETEWKR